MVFMHDIAGNHDIPSTIPAQAPGTAYGVIVFKAPFKCKIQRLELTPEATITGAATNNLMLELINRGADGTGTASLGSQTYGSGTNLSGTQKTSWYNPTTKLSLAADAVLELVKTENGAGMLLPNMRVNAIIQGD